MHKIAIYGKGGIGKSTIAANVALALAKKGLTVMQIGCDPKADSTASLHSGSRLETVLSAIRSRGTEVSLNDIVLRGAAGVLCVETGGPIPGSGCAGRGIIVALETLERLGAYEQYKPDVILYDVLGDVVCGGFSMPMRNGYADVVYIVTSGEKMALYAAGNIAMAVKNFLGRGYARLGGFILNHRNVPCEEERVHELCEDFGSKVIGELPWSRTVQEAERASGSVMMLYPESEMAKCYERLAETIWDRREDME